MNRELVQSAAKFLAKHPRWMVAAALIYFISPIDLLPEAFLGPIGYLDDFLVLLMPYLILEYAKRLKNRSDADIHDTTLE